MTFFEIIGFILAIFIVIEIGYQLANWVYRRLSNMPIPGSQEEAESDRLHSCDAVLHALLFL